MSYILPVLHPGGASQRGSHRLSMALHCPRKWFLSNVIGVVTPRPDYFVLGGAVHLSLAYAIAARDLGDARPGWMQVPLDVALAKECLGSPAVPAQAKLIALAYLRWEPRGLTTETIETEYGATLAEIGAVAGVPVPPELARQIVTSRIDRLCRDMAGGLRAIDYKTTGRGQNGQLPAQPPRAQWTLPWQFFVQTLVLRAHFGDQFRGVVLDRILVQDPTKPDFRRDPMPLPRHGLETAARVLIDACAAEQRIIDGHSEARRRGEPWLPNGHFWACDSYGKLCAMADICTQGDVQSAYDTALRMAAK